MIRNSAILLSLIVGLYNCNQDTIIEQVKYSDEVVSTPIPFAKGIISTDANSEFDLTFSQDGMTTYFSRRAPEEKQKIYRSDLKNGKWSQPLLTNFSTDRDETASITPDGQYFFFGSERPIPNRPNKGGFDMNVWMMKRTENGWGEPQPLPHPINDVQIEGEQWPSSNNNFFFSNDNQTFYYTSMKRGSKSIKLYETTFDGDTFTTPRHIDGLFDEERFWVYSAVISPDGKYLVFNSYQAPGGTGGEDIFVSQRTEKGWSKARPIGGLVNTKNEEGSPRFSRDGKYFFFSRAENLGNDQYSEWSIYFVETEYLNLKNIFDEKTN